MSNVRKKPKQRYFTKDIRSLMYGFGDVEEPLADTVDAVEDVLVHYISDICREAHAFSRVTRRQKIRVDDFKFALRRDAQKYARLKQLLEMQKDIEEARKQVDNPEGKTAKNLGMEDDGSSAPGTADGGKPKKAKKDDGRVKRKYTKSGKERKPYKKRAKKGETQGPTITPAAPSKM